MEGLSFSAIITVAVDRAFRSAVVMRAVMAPENESQRPRRLRVDVEPGDIKKQVQLKLAVNGKASVAGSVDRTGWISA